MIRDQLAVRICRLEARCGRVGVMAPTKIEVRQCCRGYPQVVKAFVRHTGISANRLVEIECLQRCKFLRNILESEITDSLAIEKGEGGH